MKWAEPPKPANHSIAADVAELKEHPGKWALVREGVATGTAAQYRRYGCESRALKNGDKRDIYARWPEETK